MRLTHIFFLLLIIPKWVLGGETILHPCFAFNRPAEQYLDTVCNKYPLYCFGAGGSEGSNLNYLSYSFTTPAVETAAEAVEVYVAVASAIKAGLENARPLRPLYFHFPLQPRDLRITIYFTDKNGKWVEDGQHPGKVREEDGSIVVLTSSDSDAKVLLSTPYRLNTISLTKPPIIPPVESYKPSGLAYERCFNDFLAKTGVAVAQANGLQYHNRTSHFYFRDMERGYSPWGWNYSNSQELNQLQVRQLALQVADALWNKIENSGELATYLKAEHAWYAQYHDETSTKFRLPPTERNIAFRITFWDDNYDRRKPPYIAQVEVEQNKISYYFADPVTQELQKPLVETFEEARSLSSR